MPPPTAPISAPRLRLLLLAIAPTAAPLTAPMIAPFWASVMGKRLPYSSVAQPVVTTAKAAIRVIIVKRFMCRNLQIIEKSILLQPHFHRGPAQGAPGNHQFTAINLRHFLY